MTRVGRPSFVGARGMPDLLGRAAAAFVLLAGCRGIQVTAPPAVPSPTATPPPTSTLPPAATPTPVPSATPSPVPTATLSPVPTHIPTPEPGPRKPILIVAGGYGGDGGTSFDDYHGRDTPSFILYADGQLLVFGGRDQYEQKYFERALSPIETCSILDRIRGTGFLTARGTGANYPLDRIYSTIKEEMPMGGPKYVIQVNGNPSKTVSIETTWFDVLVPQIRQTYVLISRYPIAGMRPFVSDRVILHLERYADIDYPPDLPVLPWPVGAPSVTSLVAAADSRGNLELDGVAGAEMKHFLKLPGIARYVDNGIEYILAGRQLLPHESRNYLSRVPLLNASIDDLPGCANRPDLAVATPAPGPSDAEWLLQQRLRVYGPGIILEELPPQGNAVATWHGWPVLKGQSGQDFAKAYRFTASAGRPELADFYKSLGKPADMRYRGMITDTYIYVPSQNESIQTLGNGRLLFSRAENGVEKAWVVIHIRQTSSSNEVAILEYDKMPFTTREMAELSR